MAEDHGQVAIRPYALEDDAAWDALVAKSWNGTLLHTRRFLSYHADRFTDQSLVIQDEHGAMRAVLPAASDPSLPGTVTSHPGITYGGIIHDGWAHGERSINIMEAIASHYLALEFHTLRYRPVPVIYHRIPAQDDLYALFRMGALRDRCDLSATIDLGTEHRMTKGRRASLQKARRLGVETCWDSESLEEFWPILLETLERRHAAKPVHTLSEMSLLAKSFPDEISVAIARVGSDLVAGAVFFASSPVLHLQYIATNQVGMDIGAADTLIDAGIAAATLGGCRYFDFGTSTEDQGRSLNDSLYRFKASFGAGGVAYEHYELTLPGSSADLSTHH